MALVVLASPLGRRLIVATVAGSAVASVTATVVNVALPSIARDLEADTADQQWILNSYLLALASLILLGGSIGDRVGRVRAYRVGLALFALASVACALAPNVEVLLVCRFGQGIAAALVTPGSLAIIEAGLREEDRDAGVGSWAGFGGVAGAVGPLVGGVLVALSWRWVFVLVVPVAALALLLTKSLPESLDPAARSFPLDLPGAALTVVVLASSSYALIARQVPLLAVAVIGAVLLWRVERGRHNAVIPGDVLAVRPVLVANAITFVVYGGMGVLFFLLSLQLQVTARWSPLAAGSALLPVTLVMLVLSARAAVVARRIGPRIPLTVGPLVMAAGMLLLRRVGPDASFVDDVLPGVLVFGAGLVAVVAPVTATALGQAPSTKAGAASALNNAVARTGSLLAVAAVPAVVGLNGDALGDPARLDAGFDRALVVAAASVAAGGLIAFVGLARRAQMSPALTPEGPHCSVDGPVTRPREVSRA